ncbi:hypothetical protein Tco_0353221 [Tanacetum coccineum]
MMLTNNLMDRHPESLSKAFFTTDKACDAVENGISRMALIAPHRGLQEGKQIYKTCGSTRGGSVKGGSTRGGSASGSTPTKEMSASFRTQQGDGVGKVHQNVQGISVPTWPYKGTPADLLTQNQADEIPNTSSQPMPDIAEPEPEEVEPEQAEPEQAEPEQAEPEQAEPEDVEHEQLVIRRRNPVIKRRESEMIKQILFKKPPPPGPGLTPDDAMVLE